MKRSTYMPMPPNGPATQRRGPRHDMVTHSRCPDAAGRVHCSGKLAAVGTALEDAWVRRIVRGRFYIRRRADGQQDHWSRWG
jgi:hypothetical protein